MTAEIVDTSTGEITASPTPYQLMPRLTDDEHADLRADIAEAGIRVPIDVDENGVVLDGHHRAWIAAELGIVCPQRVVSGLTEEQKRQHAIATNVYRRKLSAEQRREMVARLRDEGMSTRQIAEVAKVDHSTVVRDLGNRGGAAAPPRATTGRDGKTYHPKTVVDERRRNVKELVDQGFTQRQIADALGTPTSTISDDVKAIKEPAQGFTKSPSDTPLKVERIRELAARGMTSAQIGQDLGVGDQWVRQLARDNGIEINADRLVNRTAANKRTDSNRIAREAVLALDGVATTLRLINYDDLDVAEAAEWATSLTDSIRALNRFVKQIKEMTQ